MTARQIVEEVISQYLEIATNSDRSVSLKDKIDRITVELEKKINDKRNVVEQEKISCLHIFKEESRNGQTGCIICGKML
jgi:uncharacterized UBP type Zn finger protein